MNRRVWINLAAFAAIFLMLATWAVRNVLHLELVDKPYTVTAEFERSPGLRRDVEVAYLGTRIGTIGSVSLQPGLVEVTLHIDHGTVLPADVTAAVRRKSAVGEPYVDLAPGPGTEEHLAAGDRIPIDRTTTPLDYADLFAALADLVDAVPPADLTTLVHEFATGVEGQSESIHEIVTGMAQLTGTFADHADTLDDLATDLTRLTDVFAEHRQSLGSGTDDLALLAQTLAESRSDVEALLTQRPSFMGRFATLLETSGSDLGCVVDGLGTVGAALTTPQRLQDLGDLLGLGPDMLAVFQSVPDEEADGPYIRTVNPVNMGVPGGGTATEAYATPPPQPVVPEVPACPGGAAAPVAGGEVAAGAGDGSSEAGAPVAQTPGPAAEPAEPPGENAVGPAPEDGGLGIWPLVLAVVLGAPFLLAGIAARRDRRAR